MKAYASAVAATVSTAACSAQAHGSDDIASQAAALVVMTLIVFAAGFAAGQLYQKCKGPR